MWKTGGAVGVGVAVGVDVWVGVSEGSLVAVIGGTGLAVRVGVALATGGISACGAQAQSIRMPKIVRALINSMLRL